MSWGWGLGAWLDAASMAKRPLTSKICGVCLPCADSSRSGIDDYSRRRRRRPCVSGRLFVSKALLVPLGPLALTNLYHPEDQLSSASCGVPGGQRDWQRKPWHRPAASRNSSNQMTLLSGKPDTARRAQRQNVWPAMRSYRAPNRACCNGPVQQKPTAK